MSSRGRQISHRCIDQATISRPCAPGRHDCQPVPFRRYLALRVSSTTMSILRNSEEFLWVLSSRSDPAQSIEILRRAWSGPLDPRIPRDEVGHSSRAVIDATRPYEWRDKFPKVSGASRELKEKVAADWRGFLEQKITRDITETLCRLE